MGGTIILHQPPASCGLAAGSRNEEEDLLWETRKSSASSWKDVSQCCNSKSFPDVKHKGTGGEPLCMDSWDVLSPVAEELRGGESALVDDGTPSAASSESQVDAFVASLRTCTKHKDLHGGTRIHDDVSRRGLLRECSDALVTMYAKCGEVAKARSLLDMHKSSDAITWTALIAGYAREGQGRNALDCFERMQHESIVPDAVTYSCVLKACASTGAMAKGKEIHDVIARQGLLRNNVVLGGSLVDMYAKCGALSMAQHVLEGLPSRNVVSWSALIRGYAQEGQAEQAINCFEQMQRDGILPNALTYAGILKSCATIRAVNKGKEIHDEIARQGLLQNNIMLGGALVDMYAKCGALSMAQHVLEGLPSRNVVSWSALIAGYAQEGQAEQALNCFEQMQIEGIFPDAVTYACILKACAIIGATDRGREIHDDIARQGLLQNNIVLGSALVDMYAKSGALSMAQRVLEGLPSRDVVSWSALIAGYAQEGQADRALYCLEQMQHEGILPNVVTFSCMLNVCSHLGLVEEGQALFTNMSTKYDVKPDLECYTCMVDLFGRAGHLEKAVRMIQEMPSSDYLVVWLALLGACQKMGDVNVGIWTFERAIQLDKSHGPAYILMANIYAAAGMQEKVRNIEDMRIRNRACKKPSHSWWTDLNKVAHASFIGKHAQSKCIHAKLEDIFNKMSQEGYSPGLRWVSRNISYAAKGHFLCQYSEKWALACALTPKEETGSITKPTQTCGTMLLHPLV